MHLLNIGRFGSWVCLFGCIAVVSSCSIPKKTALRAEDITEHVLLDSIVVTPSTSYDPDIRTAQHVSSTRVMDLLHTDLHLIPDWKTQTLRGEARLTLTPFAYPADSLILDAQFFDVHSLSLNEAEIAGFLNTGKHLRIALGRLIIPGELIRCTITYTAHPHRAASRQNQGFFYIDPLDTISGVPQQIWTIGETHYNSQWFPTIDSPNEKHTQAIGVTVDTVFETLSNGMLTSSTVNQDGTRTDYWELNQLHAPYLTVLVVGDYDVVRESWNGLPMSYYVDRGYASSAHDIFAHTSEMLDFFSTMLEYPYPWPKYDQVIVHDFTAGAMENTSAVTFADYVQKHSRDFLVTGENDGIVAHELFHQWFGDLITCESWAHLALNEGFANYGEYLWREFKYGKDDAQRSHHEELAGYLHAASFGVHPLIYYYYDDPDHMFDAHSYNKGSLVLHHLRSVLGDDVFFRGIRKYLHDNAFGTVEVHDLRLAMEAVSGRDLMPFFDQWYFGAGHPIVTVTESYNSDQGQMQLVFDQTQDPLVMRDAFQFSCTALLFYADNVVDTVILDVQERTQVFPIPVPSRPHVIVYDPEGSLLWDPAPLERTVSQYRILLQQQNTWLVRNDAVNYLVGHMADFVIDDFRVVLKDSNWILRQRILDALDLNLIQDLISEVYGIATADPDIRVRLAACRALGRTGNGLFAPLYINLIKEENKVAEIKTGLEQLAICDLLKAIEYAQTFEKDNSIDILGAVASVYSSQGDIKHREFFRSAATRFGVQGKAFFEDFALWIASLEDSASSEEVFTLKSLALTADQDVYTRFYATYCLWALQFLLSADSDVRDLVGQTLNEIRLKTREPTLIEWYQSLD